MANTGNKVYRKLEEYVVSTGAATGNEKLNWDGGSDYIAPVSDSSFCPLPQTLYSQILAFGSDASTACSNYNSNLGGTYYTDTPNFTDATVLYSDSAGTNPAFGSIYSDGQSWRNWSGSSFTQNGICSLSR